MEPISFRADVVYPGAAPAAPTQGAKADFSAAFAHALEGVNTRQKLSATMTREFQLENPKVSLEETMVATQKASISFQALIQVRNKLVSAYQDIMNMPV